MRTRLRGEQQAEIEKLKVRIAALKADLENAQGDMLTVRSPYDGVVISLDQRTVGSVCAPRPSALPTFAGERATAGTNDY